MSERFNTIENGPHFEVVEFTSPRSTNRVLSGEILRVKGELTRHKVGSVFAYAVENGDDPLEAYERAIEHGHAVTYVFGLASVISIAASPQERVIEIDIGDHIIVEGKEFEIERAGNQQINLKLIEHAA